MPKAVARYGSPRNFLMSHPLGSQTTPDSEGLCRPVQVGNLHIPNRVILAPLAGVSDIPFRRICQEHGAGIGFVEMLSATAVRYRAERTFRMAARHESEPLLGVQLTGATPEDVVDAIEILQQRPFDMVDINMGCPVRKIVAKGWGSAILKDIDNMTRMVEQARKICRGPLSVKIRLGYTRGGINVEETAARIAGAGADMLTIHGRTRADRYSAPVEYDWIRRGVQCAKDVGGADMVVVGNGNVMDWSSARRMMHEGGCDAVMVSRGALGNPWVFRELTSGQACHPTGEEWLEVVLRHIDYQEEHYGDNHLAAILTRKHLIWYASGFPNSKQLREKISVVNSLDEARQWFRDFARGLGVEAVRYAQNPERHRDQRALEDDPKFSMDRKHDRGVGHEDPVAG